MDERNTEKRPQDFIRRGIKKPSPPGSTVLVGLRALDPLLQYAILAGSLGSIIVRKCGGTTLPRAAPVVTGTIIDRLELSPHRLALLSLAAGSALKQIFWALYTSQEELPVISAVLISLYNSTLNSANTLLFTCSETSASIPGEHFIQPRLLIGCALYAVGIAAETVAEFQRTRFKENPANEGKVCATGLFSLARHINYGAYSLWRTGYAVASAGWVFGSVVGTYHLYDFAMRGVPALDQYCQDKYGQQWTNFKAQVPYALWPKVY